MEDGIPMWGIILFGIILILDIILYGFGAALEAINENRIEKEAEQGTKKAIKIQKILQMPVIFVNTLQLLTMLANMIIGAYEWYVFEKWTAKAVGALGILEKWQIVKLGISWFIAGAVLLYIVLTFGILVPKKIARQHAEGWAYALVNPVSFLVALLKPVTFLINKTANVFISLLHMDPDRKKSDVTEEEIISMVNEGMEQGVIEDSEAEMIHNIFEFGDKAAKDIMNHRSNMLAVDGEMLLKDAMDYMLETNKSRYPVYEKDIDNVIGILHLRDAISVFQDKTCENVPVKEIAGLVRKAVFIPETRGVMELFNRMKQRKIQMVIVVDEYGQTAGFLTLEDILEEIVGNLLDEYDEEKALIEVLKDGSYRMDGLAPLEDVAEALDIEIEDTEIETLNGLLISILNRVPTDEEKLEVKYKGYIFHILQIENKTIKEVRVEKEKAVEAEKNIEHMQET